MGNLLTNLLNSAGALSTYSRVFDVIQNNIANANTPGFAEQDQSLQAASFDPSQGVGGGVIAGPLIDSRSQYLEQDVRNQQQLLGDAQQRATDLGQVQPLFDLTSTSGISNNLNNFFNSFSNLSVDPNDAESRQNVLDAAGQVAQSFNQTAQGIAQVAGNVATETTNSVTQINQLASQIAALNQQFAANADAGKDPGLQAQLNSALESLSSIANYSTIQLSDGGVNVYLGGQTPLVLRHPTGANIGRDVRVRRDHSRFAGQRHHFPDHHRFPGSPDPRAEHDLARIYVATQHAGADLCRPGERPARAGGRSKRIHAGNEPVFLRSVERRRVHAGGDEYHHRSNRGGFGIGARWQCQRACRGAVGERARGEWRQLHRSLWRTGRDRGSGHVSSAQNDQSQAQDLVTQAQQQRSSKAE